MIETNRTTYLPETNWTLPDFLGLVVAQLIGAAAGGAVVLAMGSDAGSLTVADLAITIGGQSLGALGYLTYLSRARGTRNLLVDFGLVVWPPRLGALAFGVVLQLVLAVVVSLYIPADRIEQGVSDIAGATQQFGERIVVAILVVVLAPIVEELVFRGVLLSRLVRSMPAPLAIGISGLVFASFHLLDGNLYIVPPLAVVGFVLAWVTLRDGHLGTAISIHAGYNLIGVVFLFTGVG